MNWKFQPRKKAHGKVDPKCSLVLVAVGREGAILMMWGLQTLQTVLRRVCVNMGNSPNGGFLLLLQTNLKTGTLKRLQR